MDQVTIALGGERRHTIRVGDRFVWNDGGKLEIVVVGKLGPATYVSYRPITFPHGPHGSVDVVEAAERIESGVWTRSA